MKINFYKGNIKNTKTAQIITIGEFLNYVMYEKFKPIADKVAAIEDPKERQKVKNSQLPYVTISGVFSERNEAGLLEHSGLIAVDLDKMKNLEEAKEILSKDPYTFSVFKSVSGNGLCVIVKISKIPENHKDHFRWLEQYYYDQFGFIIDSSCKDLSRPRYVSSDPKVFINEKSRVAGKKKQPRTEPKKIGWIATASQMDRIVGEVHNMQLPVADSYQDYLTCALAIADGYGEAGREYFHAVAMTSDKYEHGQADKKYTNALNTGKGRVKIGSFFYLCKQQGVVLHTDEEKTLFAIAKAAKKGSSNVEGAIKTAESMGLSVTEAQEIAEKVFERDDLDLSDKDISIVEQICAFIKMNSNLRLNEITRIVENKGIGIDDTLINTLYLQAKVSLGDSVTKGDTRAVIHSNFVDSYNPITEFIKEFSHLPEKPSIIDEFIDTIPYRDARARMFVRSWLLGIPALFHGDPVRLFLCLVGTQQTGKTEWIRRMVPDSLKRYYAESSLKREGDDAQIMCSNIIVCDDELEGNSKRDSLKLKELTSKKEFTLRLPYGESIIKLKRLAALCGTANNFQVINDPTGNTRILPVEFKNRYNFEKYNLIDKDHLFIELFRAHARGESWELNSDASLALQDMTMTYSTTDFEAELIESYLAVPENDLQGEFMSTTEVKIFLERSSGQRILSMNKLGVALKRIFDQEVRKVDKKAKRGYRCVKINGFDHI